MVMKKRQRESIERITGESADKWHPEAVKAYFAFTDRGVASVVPGEAQADLDALLMAHRQHPITVELWKRDFRHGLLWLEDFMGDFPKTYVKHAIDIYMGVFDYMPTKYREWAANV